MVLHSLPVVYTHFEIIQKHNLAIVISKNTSSKGTGNFYLVIVLKTVLCVGHSSMHFQCFLRFEADSSLKVSADRLSFFVLLWVVEAATEYTDEPGACRINSIPAS